MIQIKQLVSTVALGALLFAPLMASAADPFVTGGSGSGFLGQAQQSALNNTTVTPLPQIVGRIINVILGFLGIILLFYVLLAGFKWMTAGGSNKGTEEAKEMIKNAVIGMVIIVAGFAISNFVISQLTLIAGTSGV